MRHDAIIVRFLGWRRGWGYALRARSVGFFADDSG